MNFRLERKQWILVGILVVVGGGAAFVFFDPLGLDLLGGKPVAAAVKPVAAPVPKPAVAPNAASAPVPVSAPSAAPSQIVAPVSSPVAAPTVAKPPVAAQALKLAQSIKAAHTNENEVAHKQPVPHKSADSRSRSADLRDCLKLETDTAIAKCAGE